MAAQSKSASETAPKKKPESGISVFDAQGKNTATVSPSDYSLPKTVNKALLAQYVRVYHHNVSRQTAHSKTRGEIVGSTRKIYRQKGTGRARHGSKKAPIFVGGGVTFGPRSGSTYLRMNVKQRRAAVLHALNAKVKQNSLFIVDDQILQIEPKTKQVANILKQMELSEKKILCIIHETKTPFKRAARNIEGLTVVHTDSVNPFVLLQSPFVMCTKTAFETVINKSRTQQPTHADK